MDGLRRKARDFKVTYFPPGPHKKLTSWLEDLHGRVMPTLLSYHLHSPEFDQLFNRTWAKYDELEESRSCHRPACPRLWWQDRTEKTLRHKHLQNRQEQYSLMTDDKIDLAPLSVHLETVLKLETRPEDRMFAWRTTLDRWARFREEARSSVFLHGMSPAQRSAFEILQDWWESYYSDPALVSAAKTFMESQRKVRVKDFRHPYKGEEVARETGADKSPYHSFCFRLFCFEFNPRCWEPFQSDSCLSGVHQNRRIIASYAISHRLAYSVVYPSALRVPPRKPYASPVSSNAVWYDGVDFHHRPFYLWDAVARRTVCVGDLPVCPEYTCVSHTWGRWRKQGEAAEIPGAKWPIPENTLYDVRELPDMLGGLGDRYVWFDLFCIPQYGDDLRAKTEISRQAAIFRNCKRCIAWINQCREWSGLETALRWLSYRYLDSTSQGSLAPKLSEQESSALMQQAMCPVEVMADLTKGADIEPWFTSLWTLQEVALCPDIELYSRHWDRLAVHPDEPLSLTTLVVFLSANTLYSSPGAPRKKGVDDVAAQGAAFWLPPPDHPDDARPTMDLRRLLVSNDQWPSSAAALMLFLVSTQLDALLLNLTPMSVLVATQRRHYRAARERSPAIMSAIGVTDWYQARLESAGGAAAAEAEAEDPMLLGNLSLAFTREAAAKIGAEFFLSPPGRSKLLTSASPPGDGSAWFTSGEGTMLPFTRLSGEKATGQGILQRPLLNGRLMRDHESVAGWTILADASVEVTSACVVCFSGMETSVMCERASFDYRKPLQETAAPLPRGPSAPPDGADDDERIREWVGDSIGQLTGVPDLTTVHEIPSRDDMTKHLTEMSRRATFFAVAARQGMATFHEGILLAELPDQQDPSCRRLVKVGTYSAWGVPLPPSSSVSWRVL